MQLRMVSVVLVQQKIIKFKLSNKSNLVFLRKIKNSFKILKKYLKNLNYHLMQRGCKFWTTKLSNVWKTRKNVIQKKQKYSQFVVNLLHKEILLRFHLTTILMQTPSFLELLIMKQLQFPQKFKILFLSILFLLQAEQLLRYSRLRFQTMQLVMSTTLRMLHILILIWMQMKLLLTFQTQLSLLLADY